MKYYVKHYALRHFPEIERRTQRVHMAERQLVRLFFNEAKEGFFVDVGANDPEKESQTMHLERLGWCGVLIEPIRELCDRLREKRPRSITVQAACGSPEQRGEVKFHIAEGLLRSTMQLNDVSRGVNFSHTEQVACRTLDDILGEIDPQSIDFISIDVEGLQLDVLRGFDLKRYAPRLMLIEDHLLNLKTHRYLKRRNYRLVKRTARNNWYIPRGVSFNLTSPFERFLLWQKLWFVTPLRKIRVAWNRNLGRIRVF